MANKNVNRSVTHTNRKTVLYLHVRRVKYLWSVLLYELDLKSRMVQVFCFALAQCSEFFANRPDSRLFQYTSVSVVVWERTHFAFANMLGLYAVDRSDTVICKWIQYMSWIIVRSSEEHVFGIPYRVHTVTEGIWY